MLRRQAKKANIPKVIPPESIVKLIRSDEETPLWKDEIGTSYRVGYYSRKDGLDAIWLVDGKGDYCQTTDRDFLLKYFKIVRLSRIKDYYGVSRKPLKSIIKESKFDKKKRTIGSRAIGSLMKKTVK